MIIPPLSAYDFTAVTTLREGNLPALKRAHWNEPGYDLATRRYREPEGGVATAWAAAKDVGYIVLPNYMFFPLKWA